MAAMVMDVSMADMEDTDTERGRLRLPLMPSLVMDTDMAVDTAMAAMATDVSMVDMAVTDTARGALRLRPMPSPAMDTTAVDTDMAAMAVAMEAMAVMVMDVSMVDTADTTDKFHLLLIPLQQHSFLF